MAKVDNNKDLPKLKLFGKTILQEAQVVKNEEVVNKDKDQLIDKKPDKIIPCPRCKSMETKFCYFNNYNVNQPRHFCKGCQRYWTAGGALRNVPVGAGRRKNKPPCGVLEGFSECSLFDATAGMQFDFNWTVEEWNVAAVAGAAADYRNVFPAKRRKSISGAESW
ncbi:hypothetical protein AgCh_027989 [Apium graveolens]